MLFPICDGWRTDTVRLGPLGSGTLHALGVRLTGRGGAAVAWRLGALAVHDGPASPAAPGGLRVTDTAAVDGAVSVRLAWRRADGPVRHYELHRRLPDGSRRFLGGTCGTALYVPGLRRAGTEPAAEIEVRAVHELFTTSEPARVQLPW